VTVVVLVGVVFRCVAAAVEGRPLLAPETLVRFDLYPEATLLDDVPRTAQVLDERTGRVLVMVTRDVGMTYVSWRDAARVVNTGLRAEPV
jgi:hypothetical protein